MRLTPSLLLCLVLESTQALQIVADISCEPKKDIFNAIEQAIDMAKVSLERLNSGSDTDFANVYKRIFSTDKSDAQSLAKVTRKHFSRGEYQYDFKR